MLKKLFPLLVLLALLFTVQNLVAQVDPEDVPGMESTTPLATPPETVAMINQFRKDVENLKTPEEKAAALSQLMALQLRFADKTPAAETVQALLALATPLEKGQLRTQIVESAAFARCELDDFNGAVEATKLLDKPAETCLNVAEKFISDAEKEKSGDEKPASPKKPVDVIPLLKTALEGAIQAKDIGLEALTLAVYGRELAKQRKIDEAKTCFAQACEKAKGLEDIEERNVVGLVIRNETRSGLLVEATALANSRETDEQKEAMLALIAVTQANSNELDVARKTIDTLKTGNAKDNALIELAKKIAKTESAAKLLDLSQLLSAPERIDMFLQGIAAELISLKRFDVAEELCKASPAVAERIKNLAAVRQMETLIEEKKLDEAAKQIDLFDDPQMKNAASRHIAVEYIKAGNAAAGQKLVDATRTDEERNSLKELNDAAAKIAADPNTDARIDAQFEILQTQVQLFDLDGAKKTLASMLDTAKKVDDPAKRIPTLLVLARLYAELGEKPQAKTVLSELFDSLNGVKDLMTLKGIVPPKQAKAEIEAGKDPAEPVLVLDSPVSEGDVKEQLFIVYASTADAFNKVGESDKSKQALQKAIEMLDAESNPNVKMEKRLFLAKYFAELATEKK